jgi:hypothetical protein
MPPLPTTRDGISPLFPVDDDVQPSLYIPHVPPCGSLLDILGQVGEIDSIDYLTRDDQTQQSCFVHFTMWYDTPLSETLCKAITDEGSFRLYHGKVYLICRQNRCPVPRYRGTRTRESFIAELDPTALKPKHIRFDENDGTPTVVTYFIAPEYADKNIHQLAAECGDKDKKSDGI